MRHIEKKEKGRQLSSVVHIRTQRFMLQPSIYFNIHLNCDFFFWPWHHPAPCPRPSPGPPSADTVTVAHLEDPKTIWLLQVRLTIIFLILLQAEKLRRLWLFPGPPFLSDSTEKSVKILNYQDEKHRPCALDAECLCIFWLESWPSPVVVNSETLHVQVYELGQLRNSGWCWNS